MDVMSPLAAYRHAVAVEGFAADAAQEKAAQTLQLCFAALARETADPAPQGVYLWGAVGRGKTWLMDRFYAALQVPARRQHFHHFMRWVHIRLFQLSGTPEPLRALARELAGDVRVLCFDELFISDIGDAIILGNLLQVMFEEGVVLVCTSNQPPDQLYADGFNRERLIPAIRAIERHMQVVEVDGGADHRLHPGLAQQRYWLDEPGAAPLAEAFHRLTVGQSVSTASFELGHRAIQVVQRSEQQLWCCYAELCEVPLSALDFIDLCDRFKAIFISQVPCLSASQRPGRIARGTEDGAERVAAGDRQLPSLSVHDDSVRRFIALVDECYDRGVALYLQAAVPLSELYSEGYLSFAFRRTLSRLQEMQLARFGKC